MASLHGMAKYIPYVQSYFVHQINDYWGLVELKIRKKARKTEGNACVVDPLKYLHFSRVDEL